jgi:hypothetical protein
MSHGARAVDAIFAPLADNGQPWRDAPKVGEGGPAWVDLEAADTAAHRGRRAKAPEASTSPGFVGAA